MAVLFKLSIDVTAVQHLYEYHIDCLNDAITIMLATINESFRLHGIHLSKPFDFRLPNHFSSLLIEDYQTASFNT